ncbi:MAG: alpha/beta hydrolase [Janthinobacterium lividum]
MAILSGPSLEPVSKKIEKIVILFHGYGASGDDLLSLADEWQKDMPDTLFLLPHAPTMMTQNGGYQWFDLPDVSYQTLLNNIGPILPILQNYIDQVIEKYQVSEQDIALVGFSQGSMIAIATALIRTHSLAAVLSYSGAFVLPESYDINKDVPVLLIHGDFDQVVPIMYQDMSQKALVMRGVSVNTYICKNIGHGINQEGIQVGQDFLCQNLGVSQHKNNLNT